jgi:hypothetical protein
MQQYTENMQNARKVESLGEVETKIKIILGRLSGAQIGSFGQKNTLNKKYLASVPFRNLQLH